MSRPERPGQNPPADLKMSNDMLDLPLKGGSADPEVEPRRRSGAPAASPAQRPAPPPRPAPARSSLPGPALAWAAAALVIGALAGWFFKPDPAVAVLSSELLAFGEVRLATTSAGLRIEISNAGESALPVSRVYVDGETAEEFFLASDACSGQAVKSRQSCAVEVTFQPSETGPRQAWLMIEGEARYSLPRLPLLGLGIAPQLEAEPLKVDFGEQLVGTSTSRSTIRIANRGSAPLALEGVELEGRGAGDFGLRDQCSGKTLAPGEKCSLGYSFLPTVAGERRAVLRVLSDGADALAASPELVGRGLARRAALRFEPLRLDFGAQLTSTSTARKVTLTNAGTARLTVRDLKIRADSGETADEPPFEIGTDACAKKALSPGRSCTVEVLFRPGQEGDLTAELVIRTDAGSGQRRVPLVGSGTVPEIFLDPLVLEFGQTKVGTLSDGKFLKVVNSGTGPLDIREVRLRGAGAQAFTARPVGCTTAPLKPKSSCSVEVRFKPHRGGAFKAEVVLRHSAGEGTDRVELRGLGRVP